MEKIEKSIDVGKGIDMLINLLWMDWWNEI